MGDSLFTASRQSDDAEGVLKDKNDEVVDATTKSLDGFLTLKRF